MLTVTAWGVHQQYTWLSRPKLELKFRVPGRGFTRTCNLNPKPLNKVAVAVVSICEHLGSQEGTSGSLGEDYIGFRVWGNLYFRAWAQGKKY